MRTLNFGASLPFACVTTCRFACPPVGADQVFTQPTRTFTSGLPADWSPAPPPDITTGATGQVPLAGLSPARTPTSFAAPPRFRFADALFRATTSTRGSRRLNALMYYLHEFGDPYLPITRHHRCGALQINNNECRCSRRGLDGFHDGFFRCRADDRQFFRFSRTVRPLGERLGSP